MKTHSWILCRSNAEQARKTLVVNSHDDSTSVNHLMDRSVFDAIEGFSINPIARLGQLTGGDRDSPKNLIPARL